MIFEQVLLEVNQKFSAQIAAFVLMSNHFHMILWTPKENLDQIMNYFMHKTSLMINKKSNRINHVYGNRYGWSLIQTEEYLTTACRYLYQNPIRVHLSDRVEDYPYSTIFYLSKNKKLKFPIYDQQLMDCCLFSKDMEKRLEWLNEPLSDKQNEMIRKCIKKPMFQYPKHKQFRKIIDSLKVPKVDDRFLEP